MADRFPYHISYMVGLRWLRLNNTGIDHIPYEISKLEKLEHLSVSRNGLRELHSDVANLPNLRVLNASHNKLKNSSIPPKVFQQEDLSVVDFSHNQLKEIPEDLYKAKNMLALNLGFNEITNIPGSLFIALTDITHLDLSHNKLDSLPPQMRRLANCQTLILNDNPLQHAQLRQIAGMPALTTLHMSNTERNVNNFPAGLEGLENLTDLDVSSNNLPRVPECLYKVTTLTRLNLSDNDITELSTFVDKWLDLEYLNLSRNKLTELPSSVCRLESLRKLYVNSNQLDFEGIPAGIGKLSDLEIFSAANNNLQTMPESISRCGKLKKLILNTNRLLTLPQSIHYLVDLTTLDVTENPDLVMPPKPKEMIGSGIDYYNIDFSLEHQRKLAGAAPPPQSEQAPKKRDHAARVKRLAARQRRKEGKDEEQVLKGMRDVAKERNKRQRGEADHEDGEPIKAKSWEETCLRGPEVDASSLFDENVGSEPGLECWEIDNMHPNPIEGGTSALAGKFYTGDCYIILQTIRDEANGALKYKIYFWIGKDCTMDKQTTVAMHATNLRNLLGRQGRTNREEMDDESDEFLELFDNNIHYIEGAHASSGFYTTEEEEHEIRIYKISLLNKSEIHVEAGPLSVGFFDPRFVYLLDAEKHEIYLWEGRKASLNLRAKAKLIAEKINKRERKNDAEIHLVKQADVPDEFWDYIGEKPETNETIQEHEEEPLSRPILYTVNLGCGTLELPQVDLPNGVPTQDMLKSTEVYVLDCYTDVFVWIGRKTPKLVRAAALKLCQEIHSLIPRPAYATVTRCLEGSEPMIFKIKFKGWDDIVKVDFTRTVESIERRGHDIKEIMERDKIKTDLSALFTTRQNPMSEAEADQLSREWNEDLDGMEIFIFQAGKFSRIPDHERGHFYSGECYVFVCRYWVPMEVEEEDEEKKEDGEDGTDEEEKQTQEEIQITSYFWQGRDAGNMGWLTYQFSLQKKFQGLFKDKFNTVKLQQQQESVQFMSHFKEKFIIMEGKRNAPALQKAPVQLFHIRSNSGPLTCRCIQIPVTASSLNSAQCFILNVPFDSADQNGIVYVWMGNRCNSEEARIADEIATELFGDTHTVQIISEGEEPENFFWVGIGGRRKYDRDAEFLNYTRLFRCSNEKGYFAVSEKCTDFCQDELSDEDVMILDNGEQVYFWIGKKTNDMEIKFAFKSAQVYCEHMKLIQPDRPRKIVAALKYREVHNFTKCFHGWAKHKEVSQ